MRLIDDSDESSPAFTLEEHDRFHSILVSDGVKYAAHPNTATVLTYFVIKREIGSYEIVNVTKTFKGEKCVSKNVQRKAGIQRTKIKAEVDAVVSIFSKAVEMKSGHKLKWNKLDLANIGKASEQVRLIKEWGRVGVLTTKD